MAGWRLRAEGDVWRVVPPDAHPVASLLASLPTSDLAADGFRWATKRLALAALTAAAGTSPDGLLEERWESDAGIAFAEPTGPERDFSNVAWSWRDPTQTLVPLMLQQVTADGHDEAQLAGFVEFFAQASGTVAAAGRFYDNEAGQAFRDLLLDGRRFGVSVDPGENTDAEWMCTETDADGFCVAGRMNFTRYEIAGLTGTPFPGFARASIRLKQPTMAMAATASGNISVMDLPWAQVSPGVWKVDVTPPMPPTEVGTLVLTSPPLNTNMVTLTAGSTITPVPLIHPDKPLRFDAPPADFYRMPEPDLADISSGLLVEQEDGTYGVPLTITDAGQVYGHVARWGQCHTGYPDECVQAPPSRTGYAGFHLGQTRCADGTLVPTGVLTAGCDHAAIRLRAPQAREHYDNSGVGWATVRLTDAAYGIWCVGALRPDVSQAEEDLLRSLSLSGDWRRDRGSGSLEMLAVLAVNMPGFPQRREASIQREGLFASATVTQPGAYWADDMLESLTSSGIVRRACAECGQDSPLAQLRAELAEANARIDQLTRLTVRKPL